MIVFACSCVPLYVLICNEILDFSSLFVPVHFSILDYSVHQMCAKKRGSGEHSPGPLPAKCSE